MKKLILLIIAIIFISCETEQEPCICNNAKYFVPRIDNREGGPELGLPYEYFSNIEIDCVTGKPTWKPTPNARFIKCED